MSAGVAGAVVAAVAPSGLCSEGVFEAVPASDPALAPSLSVDVDEGPFALAIMSEREEKKPLTDICHQSMVEVTYYKSKLARTAVSTATFCISNKNQTAILFHCKNALIQEWPS